MGADQSFGVAVREGLKKPVGRGLASVVSHPCRKVRVKDGAPSFVDGVEKAIEGWATRLLISHYSSSAERFMERTG